jgi:FkbM family methyltransferase
MKLIVDTLLSILSNRFDLIGYTQRLEEKKFFREPLSNVENILKKQKITILDVGAAEGLEKGFEKYNKFLKKVLVDPLDDQALDYLIGSKNGEVIFNICKKNKCSSILEPKGEFLDYYTLGNSERLEVIKQKKFQLITIENMLKKNKINNLDYLKIDVQGYEQEVLKGLGKYKPIIIKMEISFVPLYKNSSIIFEVCDYLYKLGYITFHLAYCSKTSPSISDTNKKNRHIGIPLHGDIWFMPDWTRQKGKDIIKNREPQYEALMMIFDMSNILEYKKHLGGGI